MSIWNLFYIFFQWNNQDCCKIVIMYKTKFIYLKINKYKISVNINFAGS